MTRSIANKINIIMEMHVNLLQIKKEDEENNLIVKKKFYFCSITGRHSEADI